MIADHEFKDAKEKQAFLDEMKARLVLTAEDMKILVKLAKEFSLEEKSHRITLEIYAPTEPMVLRASNGAQEFVGLLIPLRDPPGAG